MKDAGPQNWISPLTRLAEEQERRNTELLRQTPTLAEEVRSEVVPLTLDLAKGPLPADASAALSALEKDAARIAIESLISLAKVNDIDHLGGGLELIPGLLLTLSTIDYETRHFAIEHGHTSIGYYSALAALGFLPRERVIEKFRRSLDIAGHVSWVPGGTPLGSGRLGVTVPVSTGLALGLKARKGSGAFVICHCGDAGWISGQALNGFNGADVHRAPITFVMHRNGIQLSGTTAKIMDKDPRPIVVEPRDHHPRDSVVARAAAPLRRVSRGVCPRAAGQAVADLSRRIHIDRGSAGNDPDVCRDVRHRARDRGVCRQARRVARHRDLDSGFAHELPRSARHAASACSGERVARWRGASRRWHEGPRRSADARESDAAAHRRGDDCAAASPRRAATDCRDAGAAAEGHAQPGAGRERSRRDFAAWDGQVGVRARRVGSRLRRRREKVPRQLLLCVLRSQSVHEAGQGRGASP